jgi:hypothetical protein
MFHAHKVGRQLNGVMRILLSMGLLGFLAWAVPEAAVAEQQPAPIHQSQPTAETFSYLSPYWPQSIQRWGALIYKMAYLNGLDPDFVAAIVSAESSGRPDGVSEEGAVGLMGIMPRGRPGLELRPSAEQLLDPNLNMRWGTNILVDILQQTGGDVAAALSAYNAGWYNMHDPIPQQYTAKVLDEYGRALAAQAGTSPHIASQWTVAIEMRRGYVPPSHLLVFGQSPHGEMASYGEQVIFDYVSADGTPYYVRGHAVPLIMVDLAPLAEEETADPALQMGDEKGNGRNTRLLIACLPTLSRLRGHLSTRWFAPSTCPTERELE